MVFQHQRPYHARRLPLYSASITCLLLVLLVVGCTSPQAGSSNATATRTPRNSLLTPTVPTSIAHTFPTVITNLRPITTPLAPPPHDCDIKPPTQQKHLNSFGDNTNVQLVGGGVFWFYGMYYASVLHLSQPGSDQRWPMTKWVVEVGPNYALPVTLRLRNSQTNTLAWWTDGQAPPAAATQTLILNPLTSTNDVGSVPGVPDIPHGPSGPGWVEWGLFPVFFAAGCYALEVSWSGGSWQSIMAVGG